MPGFKIEALKIELIGGRIGIRKNRVCITHVCKDFILAHINISFYSQGQFLPETDKN